MRRFLRPAARRPLRAASRSVAAAQPVHDGQHVLRLRLHRVRDARRFRNRRAVHRLCGRPRHARRPDCAADRDGQRLRRGARFAGRRHFVWRRAGDPLVRLGAAAARPPGIRGRFPVRQRGGAPARALQHPERGGERQTLFRRDAEPAGRRDRGGDGLRLPVRAARLSRRAASARDGAGAGAAHGEHDPLPQLQDHRPEDAATLHGPLSDCASAIMAIATHPAVRRWSRSPTAYLSSAFIGLAVSRIRHRGTRASGIDRPPATFRASTDAGAGRKITS